MSQNQNAHHEPQKGISEFNRSVVEEFRANGGRVGGMFEGGNLLLLTTVGARSGRERTTPLGYLVDGDRLVVVASAGGSPRHPAWYHNLLANPMTRVEVGTETFDAIAVPAEDAERDRLWEWIAREELGFAEYQKGVQRRLPVVVLERSSTEPGPARPDTLGNRLIEIHTWLREQLRHVRTEADAHFAAREDGTPTPPVGLSLQIRQHCLAFCQSLRFHHTVEDTNVLPDLERQYPDLRDAITRLRAEHRTVARIQAELEELLAHIATADPERFRAELDRMAQELETHLDYEEEALIPTLNAVPLPPG